MSVDYSDLEESEETFQGFDIYRTEIYGTKRKVVILECQYCGDEFTVRPKEVKTGRKFCSPECSIKTQHQGRDQNGENNPNWKGGISENYYEENKEEILNQKQLRRQRNRLLLWKVKEKSSCQECGEENPLCLDFHHRNSDEKLMSVSNMANNTYSTEKLVEEIKKCDVLCSNCHRKHTFTFEDFPEVFEGEFESELNELDSLF